MMTIGEAIRNARNDLGMSVNDLSHDTGIPGERLREYEYGRSEPNWNNLRKLIYVFGLSFIQDAMEDVR